MSSHPTHWKKMQRALTHQRVPQSMFFVGPLHCAISDYVIQLMQLFLCKISQNEPCLSCIDCQMISERNHPDMEWIKPEKNGGSIKIDQIRELQQAAYLTPQRTPYRLIAIEAADRMNTASANALLKILEEPAPHTIFILMAQQLSTVLPTVLSRCQIVTFSSSDNSYSNNLLMLGEQYPELSEQAVILKQAEPILDGLIALIERRQHPCILASQWTQFELSTLLWFLYLVYSQLQQMHIGSTPVTGPANNQLIKLLSLLDPVAIFAQIDKINTLLRKLSHNININHLLVLEDLLFSLGSIGIS
jgi:DNA polymerase-3 subunit delta'